MDLWLKTIDIFFFNDKIILQSQQRFKSDHHEVYTEEVKKLC